MAWPARSSDFSPKDFLCGGIWKADIFFSSEEQADILNMIMDAYIEVKE